jgi:hypothetical protein
MVNTGEKVRGRPFTAWFLIVLMFGLGLGALISGPMLFLASDGRLMLWTVDQLESTPFPDYLIPDIILFVFMGIYPALVGLGLVKDRWQGMNALNPFKNFRWAWTGSLAAGIILLIWIAVETLMLGYISFLQPVMAVWGVLVILLTLLPNVRKYYRIN